MSTVLKDNWGISSAFVLIHLQEVSWVYLLVEVLVLVLLSKYLWKRAPKSPRKADNSLNILPREHLTVSWTSLYLFLFLNSIISTYLDIYIQKIGNIWAFKKRDSRGLRIRHNRIKIYRKRCRMLFFEKLEFEDVDILPSVFSILNSIIIQAGMRMFFGHLEALTFGVGWNGVEKWDTKPK